MTKPGDVDYFTRVRCYQLLLVEVSRRARVKLSLLPLAMRMGGPREAIWHALIRKNHGCTHFIVGRDHAGPGKDTDGKPFYGPYEAQELFKKHEADIGVTMVPFNMMVYLEDQDRYVPDNEVKKGDRVLNISGTELRAAAERRARDSGLVYLSGGGARTAPQLSAPHKQGVTIFFTGLSGSGKSTIANVLLTKFLEVGGRPVTLLDGDLVRKHLSSELGFSKEHRDINIRRIGYVASEITKNGGIAICAPIAPYDATRKHVRQMVEPFGGFILVHIATPVEVCEQRDRKGLYAKARAGILKEFTGISDPYEAPADAEVVINTARIVARRSGAGDHSAPGAGRIHRSQRGVGLIAGRRPSCDLRPVRRWICVQDPDRLRGRHPDRNDRVGGRRVAASCADLRSAGTADRRRRIRRAVQFRHQDRRQRCAPAQRHGAAQGGAGAGRGQRSGIVSSG